MKDTTYRNENVDQGKKQGKSKEEMGKDEVN